MPLPVTFNGYKTEEDHQQMARSDNPQAGSDAAIVRLNNSGQPAEKENNRNQSLQDEQARGNALRPLSPNQLTVRFSIALISILTTEYGFLEIIEWMFEKKILAGKGALGISILLLNSALLAAIYLIAIMYQHMVVVSQVAGSPRLFEKTKEDKELEDTLMTDVRTAFQSGNWEEVLKVGSVLSRPLWLTGKYKLRVELGYIVENAAVYRHNYAQQAGALIDDIGWTSFVLGDSQEARRAILHGISIADKHRLQYLAYKGHRHLSGIDLHNGDFQAALQHLEHSKRYAEQIDDAKSQAEALAGIFVNQAIIEMKRQQWIQALESIETAQGKYKEINDTDRQVKLYHFKGDILYEMGQLDAAKDVYREGLLAAKQESRKDGILKNLIGIAKVAIREYREDEAKQAYEEASIVAQELGRKNLAQELRSASVHLPKKPLDVTF